MGTADHVVTMLVLVRHGEAHCNVERVLVGLRGCRGLTDLGRRQVAALGAAWTERGFRPDVLLSSPVRRARQSAEILSVAIPDLTVQEDCALCELHLGEADGLTWSEYEARYARLFDLLIEPDRPYAPDAECWSDVMRRVRRCLDDLTTAHAGETIAVISHAGWIVAALLELLSIPAASERAYLDPAFASMTWWRHELGRWTGYVQRYSPSRRAHAGGITADRWAGRRLCVAIGSGAQSTGEY